MHILNFLLLFSFINLYNSCTLINKKMWLSYTNAPITRSFIYAFYKLCLYKSQYGLVLLNQVTSLQKPPCINFISQKYKLLSYNLNEGLYLRLRIKQPYYNLNMGCDYYIDKDLEIYDYNYTLFSYINLDHKRGYYWFSSLLNDDEDGYNKELTEYINNVLDSNIEPIIIYNNNTFSKLSFENKYKQMIEDKLNFFNKTWNDVSKIIKIENRYER